MDIWVDSTVMFLKERFRATQREKLILEGREHIFPSRSSNSSPLKSDELGTEMTLHTDCSIFSQAEIQMKLSKNLAEGGWWFLT